MPNNFRKTGDYYISKAGHDSNNGLTPDTPKKSIAAYGQGDYILGAGQYTTSFNIDTRLYYFFGDGGVDIKDSTFSLGNMNDIRFLNSTLILRGLALFTYVNITIIDCIISSILGETSWDKCKLINTDVLSGSDNGPRYIENSIILNSSVLMYNATNARLKSTYIDFSSIVNIQGNNSAPSSNIINNNIQGVIIIGGNNYAIQDQLTGTPQDNGYAVGVEWLTESQLTADGYTGTITGWDAAVATCINRDPKFNDVSKLDFTLQADSPHIGRASDGISNIGGTEYSQSFYAGISNPNTLLLEGDSDIDKTSNINDWVLITAATQGQIRAIVKISDTDEEIGTIDYIGNLAFDSDTVGGGSDNFNVPDSKPVSNDYPDYLQTTSDAPDVNTLIIANHGASVGEWLKVEGQYREIATTPDANTITFTTAVRAIVLSGTDVQIGTFNQLAALNPNRLNYLLRTSKQVVNSGNWDDNATWDNDNLATAGSYLAQEWNSQPMIDNNNGVGFGDDDYDSAFGNTIQAKYLDLLIYLRDDYKS